MGLEGWHDVHPKQACVHRHTPVLVLLACLLCHNDAEKAASQSPITRVTPCSPENTRLRPQAVMMVVPSKLNRNNRFLRRR
jgi:hypothetical protein